MTPKAASTAIVFYHRTLSFSLTCLQLPSCWVTYFLARALLLFQREFTRRPPIQILQHCESRRGSGRKFAFWNCNDPDRLGCEEGVETQVRKRTVLRWIGALLQVYKMVVSQVGSSFHNAMCLTIVGLAHVVLITYMCQPVSVNAKSKDLTRGAKSTLHHPAPFVSCNWVSLTCSAGSVDSDEYGGKTEVV